MAKRGESMPRKKIVIGKTMTEQELFSNVERMPQIEQKLDVLIIAINGDPQDNNNIGLKGHVIQTNGKVKWNTKMIYCLWGCFGAAIATIAVIFINHLGGN